jgi:hypothetical protein
MNISDEGTKAFLLPGFVDRFLVLVTRLTRRVELSSEGSARKGAVRPSMSAIRTICLEASMIERRPLTQQGGQETSNLLHFGMLIVDLDCGHAGQRTLDEITGSSHYCVTTIAGGVGSRDRRE